jgi:UDP-N-acetylmuramoyl-tripeptide--D-alanyl-D-alanine ligase
MKTFVKSVFLRYFRELAKLQLKKYCPDIIGITGSAGKTSTKYALHAILKDKFRTKTSFKANSEWGIPINILGLKPYQHHNQYLGWLLLALKAPWRLISDRKAYEKYIVELGIDSPHPPQNMEYLLTIVKPRVGIFLNVQPTHSEPFDHLVKEVEPKKRRDQIREVIAAEKGKLIESLPADGLAILNADDDRVIKFAKKTKAQVSTFGKTDTADLTIVGINQSLAGTKFDYRYHEQKIGMQFKHLLLPDHFGHTFAAAILVAVHEGCRLEEAVAALVTNYKLPRGRASLIPGKKGSIIIDSSYNASAVPMIDSLNLLAKLKAGKTYAILGDMRELGDETQGEHEQVAKVANQICDRVLLVGPQMKDYALPILKDDKGEWYESGLKAAASLLPRLKPTDVVLVKGSQNTLFLETAVEKLMRQPEKADDLLCRRGEFWNRRRREAGLD